MCRAGRYGGVEVLSGGTFPITSVINAAGIVNLTDVDNISASAKLDGDTFTIRRLAPFQVFTGTVTGEQIKGKTHGNTTFGDGTFTAQKKK